ncbi:MAG: carboxypeptidase regulatory-like domain-containing protein [Sphingobacteriaceae bacterium]|nr:carboxypeptidase regulatory-like domain-containing protein [Cytophagaceae bacterium]
MNSFPNVQNRRVLPVLLTLAALACTGPNHEVVEPDGSTQPQAGIVSGKVTDGQGRPLPNASIVANNSQFYNQNVLGQTDASGRYRLELRPGSWYVRGTVDLRFDNKTYTLDLHPDTDAAFAGTEGAVRNLRLKVSGDRSGEFGNDGYYGGQLEVFGDYVDSEFFDTEDLELRLEPVGPLLDGSEGKILLGQPDRMYLDDVPLGKYKITARHTPTNQVMQVRLRNQNQAYAPAVTASFDPAYAGAKGRYKLNLEVKLPQ